MYPLNHDISRLIVADRQRALRREAHAERLARLARSGVSERRYDFYLRPEPSTATR